MRSPLGIPLASLILGALMATACSKPEPSPRVLLIGVDGLEWSVLAPMVRAGELPHLRTLMERGVYGKIETIEPTLSPVVWTTIATGKVPDKHGVHHFIHLDSRGQQTRLYDRRDRRAKAFWNILSDQERRVHVVGWFLTYPAEPVRGFMVSQFTSLSRAAEFWKGTLEEGIPYQTYPESFLEEVVADIRSVEDEAGALKQKIFDTERPETAGGMEARLVEHTLWALEADALYGRIAERILRSDPDFDALAVYFGGPDVAGHRFWRYYRPAEFRFPPSKEKSERFEVVIPNYYRYVDEWIGRLLSACGEEVTVFVVSDHGMYAVNRDVYFESLQRVQQMNSGHHLEVDRAPGVIVAAGPGVRKGSRGEPAGPSLGTLESLGSVLEVTPTLLYLLGAPVARDMDGQLMEAVLDPRFRESHPLVLVDTYEQPGEEAEAERLDPELEREMMERFRQLGYIGSE